jgi:hypothetical protein
VFWLSGTTLNHLAATVASESTQYGGTQINPPRIQWRAYNHSVNDLFLSISRSLQSAELYAPVHFNA